MVLTKFIFLLSLLCITYSRAQTEDADTWVNNLVTPRRKLDLSQSNDINHCTAPGVSEGRCVKPSECLVKTEKVDPTTLFNPRISDCHYLRVCCPVESIWYNIDVTSTAKALTGCGWSYPGAHVFRTSLDYAEYGEFRWMVAVLKESSKPGIWEHATDYLGGGSLIHPSVVLTVAHNVHLLKPNMIKCRIGEWDTRTLNEFFPHQDSGVKKIIVHPEFIRARVHYDAALLLLKEPISLENNPSIGVGCLGMQLPSPGTPCYSMGWGKKEYSGNEYVNILKKVQVRLVEKDDCQEALRNTKLGSGYYLHNSLTCAGGEEGIDTCTGDGGSSLVCQIPSNNQTPRFAIYGMVAFGIGCGSTTPGVYVNVPMVYDWVIETMFTESLNSTTFVPTN